MKYIKTPLNAVKIAKQLINDWHREYLIGIYCNSENKILHIELIGLGIVDHVIIHPREVFKPAIIKSATKIILLHNHPSDNCQPSPEDEKVMLNLEKVGILLGIKITDQIIFTPKKYYSFKSKTQYEY